MENPVSRRLSAQSVTSRPAAQRPLNRQSLPVAQQTATLNDHTAVQQSPQDPKHAIAQRSMIATGNPQAAFAARHILDKGGNAVDAAIAADVVMGVVEPLATGIGGDLLAMIVPVGKSPIAYNGTGKSPAALDPDVVSRLPGGRIPERHPLSVTTPGLVRGWHDVHRRFGRLDWATLFEEAVRLCDQGYKVHPVLASEWKIFDHVLHNDPCCATLHGAGRPPQAGDIIKNHALGGVLRDIMHDGWTAFYHGPRARQVATACQRMGGVLAESDLAAHEGFFCEPMTATLGDLQLHQCPPNTQGLAVLAALSRLNRETCGSETPGAMLEVIQATDAAMQHAAKIVADPAGNTVCTVVVDGDGLAITLMSSIFRRFGSAIAVPEGGFVLQNRGHGFATPGGPNGAGPGRRAYHTVVPGAVTRNGRFHLGMGVVGGLMQPQGQIQILTRHLLWGQPLSHAVQAPRWRLEGHRRLAIEDSMPAAIRDALRQAGYQAPDAHVGELAGRSDFGGAQAVKRLDDGRLEGVSDRRKDGIALGCDY